MHWSRKLRAAGALTGAEWCRLWRAWWLLLLVDGGLRWLPFRVVQGLLDRARPGAGAGRPGDADAVLREMALAVDRAARYHLYPMTCLRRALVRQRLCRAAGIPTRLCFGVRRADESLAAHAWVEYDGKPVGEFEGTPVRFSRLTSQKPAAPAGGCMENSLDCP